MQAHPQNPTGPDRRKGFLQQWITGWNHHKALRIKPCRDFTFGGGDRFTTSQPADVGGANVRDHGDVGLGAVGEPGNLPRPAHAHFDHQSSGVRAGPQHREGNTDVIVVVAFTGLNGPQGSQSSTDQLAGGGLSGGTGHRHEGTPQLPTMQQRQLLVGRKGVVHTPMQQSRRQRLLPVAAHHSPLGPSSRKLDKEVVPVKPFAHQRHEEIT